MASTTRTRAHETHVAGSIPRRSSATFFFSRSDRRDPRVSDPCAAHAPVSSHAAATQAPVSSQTPVSRPRRQVKVSTTVQVNRRPRFCTKTPVSCFYQNFLVAYPNLVFLDFLESLGCVDYLGRLCFVFCDMLNYSNFKL